MVKNIRQSQQPASRAFPRQKILIEFSAKEFFPFWRGNHPFQASIFFNSCLIGDTILKYDWLWRFRNYTKLFKIRIFQPGVILDDLLYWAKTIRKDPPEASGKFLDDLHGIFSIDAFRGNNRELNSPRATEQYPDFFRWGFILLNVLHHFPAKHIDDLGFLSEWACNRVD